MPDDFVDPYTFPNTRVLRNKLGITDDSALKEFEYEASKTRAQQLRVTPIVGSFDLKHLQAIHEHLFQDVYEWAGELRTVGIAKENSIFARPEFIAAQAKRLHAEFLGENKLLGLEKKPFVERLAFHYAEWNVLHPFREGNGRSQREFIVQISRNAGYELDQTQIDNSKDQWNHAARRSFHGDPAFIEVIFTKAVRPSRVFAFDHLPPNEALAQHPELQGSFKTLQAAREFAKTLHFSNRSSFVEETRASVMAILDAGKLVLDPPEQMRDLRRER